MKRAKNNPEPVSEAMSHYISSSRNPRRASSRELQESAGEATYTNHRASAFARSPQPRPLKDHGTPLDSGHSYGDRDLVAPNTPSSDITTSSFSSSDVAHAVVPAVPRSSHTRRHGHSRPRTRLEELSLQLWLHPNIKGVVEKLLSQLEENFSYPSAWLMMQIMDLQIIYQLSKSPLAGGTPDKTTRFKVSKSCILWSTLVTKCALVFSRQHVLNHIAPMCWLEREIQLRVLVSSLSLLHLFEPNCTGPRLTNDTADLLKDNIMKLWRDLQNGGGTAAEKGDCEFLVRYAVNLLGNLPGDESTSAAVASRVTNFLFAAGTAYQYSGQQTVEHLRKAFRPLRTKPSEWHAEIDQYHHLTMSLLALSLCSSDFDARNMFRALCTDLISTLRQKLRDQLAIVNERHTLAVYWGKVASHTANVAGSEPTDNPTNLTYGLMYLLCRLVERLVAEGGGLQGDEEQCMADLMKLLVSVCQNSRFDEIKYKAHEIIFLALSNTAAGAGLSSFAGHVEIPSQRGESRSERRKREERNESLVQQGDAIMGSLKKRKKWAESSFTGADEDMVLLSRDGYKDPVLVFEEFDLSKQKSKEMKAVDQGSRVAASPQLSAASSSLSDRVEQGAALATTFVKKTGERLSKLIHNEAVGERKDPKTLRRPSSHHSGHHEHALGYPYSPDAVTGRRLASQDTLSGTQPIPIHHTRRDSHRQNIIMSPRSPRPSPDAGHSFVRGSYETRPSPNVMPSSQFPGPASQGSNSSTMGSLGDGRAWKESPSCFNVNSPMMIGVERVKVKGTPEGACLSQTCKTVLFLSKKRVEVYSVPLPRVGPGTELEKRLTHVYEAKLPSSRKDAKEFLHASVNDNYLAVITLDRLDFVDIKTRKCVSEYFDVYESQRLCTVAVSPGPPKVAVAFLDTERRCAIKVYHFENEELHFERTLYFGGSIPPGQSNHLMFSPDGEYVACSCDTHGYVGTWDLQSASNVATIMPEIPVNDGRGGMDGVTSVKMFPRNRYILATTGSTDAGGSAFIAPRSLSKSRPRMHKVGRPSGPIKVGAVAPEENAIAFITADGKVFISRLDSSTMGGYKTLEAKCLGEADRVQAADAAFVQVGNRNVLVAAFGGMKKFSPDGYGRVLMFEFPALKPT